MQGLGGLRLCCSSQIQHMYIVRTYADSDFSLIFPSEMYDLLQFLCVLL